MRLTLVVCGAPLASRTTDIFNALVDAGWEVSVSATRAAAVWVDELAVSYRESDSRFPRPDAVVVCPMTFNTGNKWALGIADGPTLGRLCEALGLGIPVVAVPFVNEALWAHPAWESSLAILRRSGVSLIDARLDQELPAPLKRGTGEAIAAAFDPARLVRELAARGLG